MKTNDLKKGARVRLAGTGWYATIADNKKGNVRLADVEGLYREIGSVYAHDIEWAQVFDGTQMIERWEKVEHTPAQLKLKATVEGLFR